MNSEKQSNSILLKFVSDFNLTHSWICPELKSLPREWIWNCLSKPHSALTLEPTDFKAILDYVSGSLEHIQYVIGPADDLTASFIMRCGFEIDLVKQSILRDKYGVKYRVFRRKTLTLFVVDVIVTCYNCGRYIKECLDSILSNSHPRLNLQIIVVNDYSSDNSFEMLENYSNNDLVTIIHMDHNLGASDARNKGLSVSTAPHVIFFDGDDTMSPTMINSLCEAYSDDIDFVYPGYWQISGEPNFEKWSNLKVHGAAVVKDGKSIWIKIQEFEPNRVKYVNYLQTTCLIKHSRAVSTPWLSDVRYLNDWAWYSQLIDAGAIGRRAEHSWFKYRKFSRPESLTNQYRRAKGFEQLRRANWDRLKQYGISTPYYALSIRWDTCGKVKRDWVTTLRQLPLAAYGGMHVDICDTPSTQTSMSKYSVYIFHDVSLATSDFIFSLPPEAIVVIDLTTVNSTLYYHVLSSLKRANLIISADYRILDELSDFGLVGHYVPSGCYNGHLFYYGTVKQTSTINLWHPTDTNFKSTDVLMIPSWDLPIPPNTVCKNLLLWNVITFFNMKYDVTNAIPDGFSLAQTHSMVSHDSNNQDFYNNDTLIGGEKLQGLIRDVYRHSSSGAT